MAVHVAEAADVHENVEAQGGAGVEGAEGFVVAAAVAQAQLDDLVDAGFGQSGDQVADLPVGVVAGGVEQRRGQLDFKGFGAFDQVDHAELAGWASRRDFGGGLGQFGLRFDAGRDWAAAYLTSVGAVRTSRVKRLRGLPRRSAGIRACRASSTNAAAAWALTFQAGPVAASRSLRPRSRTSAAGWESRRETWVSRVRALTIWPSEVLVASGSR